MDGMESKIGEAFEGPLGTTPPNIRYCFRANCSTVFAIYCTGILTYQQARHAMNGWNYEIRSNEFSIPIFKLQVSLFIHQCIPTI